jgi:regulatory helix-turn-helix LysR family protein
MDLKRLRTFIAVAEKKGFERAAERPALAQPAVSKHIKDLAGTARQNPPLEPFEDPLSGCPAMFAVTCSTLARPLLPVIGRRDVAHSCDRDGQPHDGHLELARGARGTYRGSGLGKCRRDLTSWQHRSGLYGRSRSCHRSCDFRRNFVTEAAIPSLALERHAGKERHA